MHKNDRDFRDKRFDRILDTYEKDKHMKDMHDLDGFTHFLPAKATAKFPHLIKDWDYKQ
jgi:hypothetical protein